MNQFIHIAQWITSIKHRRNINPNVCCQKGICIFRLQKSAFLQAWIFKELKYGKSYPCVHVIGDDGEQRAARTWDQFHKSFMSSLTKSWINIDCSAMVRSCYSFPHVTTAQVFSICGRFKHILC